MIRQVLAKSKVALAISSVFTFSVLPVQADVGFAEHVKTTFDKDLRQPNSMSFFREIRKKLKEYDIEEFYKEMEAARIFSNRGIRVSEGFADKPANPFAMILTHKISYSFPNLLTSFGLDTFETKYMVIRKEKVDADRWNDPSGTDGKLPMSPFHEFLIPRELNDWTLFNVLTLGIQGGDKLTDAITLLKEMKSAARDYADKQNIANIGLYFHCFPFNSVNVLHLHTIDQNITGPSYEAQKFKNLQFDSVLQVLEEELLVSKK